MSYQITILTPNKSFVEAFFVSEPLYQELVRIAAIFELKYLNLSFLQEIKIRAIATCYSYVKTLKPLQGSALASLSLDWFDELTALIDAVEKLPHSHSLSIYLS